MPKSVAIDDIPTTVDVASNNAPPGSRSANVIAVVLLVLGVALVMPVAKLGVWMSSRDYYEHVPLMALFAFILGVYRYRQEPTTRQMVVSPRVLLWTLIASGFAVGTYVLPSRWMAAPATVATVMAALTLWGGREMTWRLRGPLVLLVACIPLPVLMDSWFVVEMQQLATWLASLWLDLMGILHLSTGVEIRTPENNFAVADACSGIHSMFAAIAVGVGYSVLRNYRVWRILALVVQMVFWVVIANAIRVFVVVYAQSRYGIDLSTGLRHDLLGMVTFATGVLMATSSDHFWRYLLPGTGISDDESPASPSEVNGSPIGFLDSAVSPRAAVIVAGVLVVFGLGGVAAFSKFSRLSLAQASMVELAQNSAIDFDTVDESFFPAEIAGWTRTNFIVNEKTEESIFGGMKSFIWQYSNGSRAVLLSVDGPYNDWHDLAMCYSGVGWQVSNRSPYPFDGNENFVAADLSLERPPLERAEVLFACLDPRGDCVAPPPHFGDAWIHLINRMRWAIGEKQSYGGGVIQVQLLDETPVKLSRGQIRDNHELFQMAVMHAFGGEKE
ncbi:Transmembrane exosortase [Planctomycetes bacterium CA13]|uniref:Transmembrane exosortase n=1 Tax=Novipirellula herctigrandis TaxID=2527986 RepID=A0A5C5YYU7_9BACT|nr:Transmembrane exosortase [Planctomycetes bacterium CA13]